MIGRGLLSRVSLSVFTKRNAITKRNITEFAEVVTKRENRKHLERQQILKESCSGLPTFTDVLNKNGLWPLKRKAPSTLQMNVGLLCNQTCHHCHVEAGPTRTRENADKKNIDRILQLLQNTPSMKVVDITGGAPELNPHFKFLVSEAKKMGRHVIDRCNLTVLEEKGQEDTAQFLAENKVQIVASLPCYTEVNVEKQRGKGVFGKSIQVLEKLNKLGYGIEGTGLQLSLVYNPGGAFLPGAQHDLELAYKEQLDKNFGLKFNDLFTITNMPIKRFADSLFAAGEYSKYMSLLVNHFNPNTVDSIMCRDLVSVSWDGRLFDCDFNQMLNVDIGAAKSHGKDGKMTIWDIDSFEFLEGARIATDWHCFGCTAGAGSSCTGALN